nr:hypothetical protein [Nocardia abscessus]
MNGTAPLVPPGPVTVTGTIPVPAGVTAVIWVSELTVNEVAGVLPKLTAVAPVKPEPVRVTVVPPPVEPWLGLMLLNAGTGT